MRKNFFNDEENGVLKAEKPQAPAKNPMQGVCVQIHYTCTFFSGKDATLWIILCYVS